jgi:hypothetical protein
MGLFSGIFQACFFWTRYRSGGSSQFEIPAGVHKVGRKVFSLSLDEKARDKKFPQESRMKIFYSANNGVPKT